MVSMSAPSMSAYKGQREMRDGVALSRTGEGAQSHLRAEWQASPS